MATDPKRMPHFGDKNIVCRINKVGGHFGSTQNDVNLMGIVNEFAWLEFLMLNPDDDKSEKKVKFDM